MKTLSKAVAVASLLSAGVMSANIASAEVVFNASLVSDYVFRGASYTSNGAALQGGADYSHDSGAYAGAWLSNIETADADGEIQDDVEYDIYAGYWMEAGEFEIDLSYITYNYADADDWNTTEISASISTAGITASVYQDIDAANTTYLGLAYSAELPQELSLDVAVGHTVDGKVDGEAVWGEDFTDVSASVGKSFDIVDVALTVTNVNYADAEDDTLVFLTASTEF